MSKVVKCDPALLQLGDQVVIATKSWTLQGKEGPDHTGTYDLYLGNTNGEQIATIAHDPVTIIM
jgi:hypothetical protein